MITLQCVIILYLTYNKIFLRFFLSKRKEKNCFLLQLFFLSNFRHKNFEGRREGEKGRESWEERGEDGKNRKGREGKEGRGESERGTRRKSRFVSWVGPKQTVQDQIISFSFISHGNLRLNLRVNELSGFRPVARLSTRGGVPRSL